MHKETIEFNRRLDIMREKRNTFFAEAIRTIGKTKLQLKKEKNEKIMQKRFINLGGGFELPKSKSGNGSRRRLMRSGTMTNEMQQ